MKKTLLYIVFSVIIQLLSFGQSNETEPNNNFATANLIEANEERTAELDGVDTVDYHTLYFDWNANFHLTLEVTNNGSTAEELDLIIYNTLRINGEYVGGFHLSSYLVNPGETFQDNFVICGKAIDSFYLVFKSQGNIEYNFTWEAVNTYPHDGYNNTAATATPFTYNVEKRGSVKYEFWGDQNFDTTDYFTSTLPAGNYSNAFLNIIAESNSCDDDKWISYACYKNGNPIAFDSGYVGNNSSVNSYQQVASAISLSNMVAGDVLLVKYKANGPFGYKFKYGPYDEFAPDVEDNCCTYNAIPIIENIPKSGNVGEYDYDNDEYIDEFDTYRIILPQDGAFNLVIKGRNDQCDYFSNYLTCNILDKYGNEVFSNTLMQWDGPACGEIKTDSIKFRAFAKDTFYLQLTADEKVSYNIRYLLADSTGSDANESYNNTVTTVIPINVGEVKKGHIRFIKDANLYDPSDIYRTTLPADGSITVYLKATYRSNGTGTNSSNSNRLTLVTTGFTDRTPSNPPVTNFTPDAVYLDTFLICGLGAGDHYFTLSSSLPYEYEFRYEITDTSTLDNDIEPNNSFAEATTVAGGATKKGHVNYTQNVTTDMFDFYKLIYLNGDSIKLPIQATNTSCENNKNMHINVYNKNHGLILSRLIANNSSVNAGQTIYDTVNIFLPGPDTIYLRFDATDAFKYEFGTSLHIPVITGNTAVCYGAEVYTAANVGNASASYNWSLPLGGGSLVVTNDTVATVTWNGSGNRSVQLYLSNAGGNSGVKTLAVFVDSAAATQIPVISNFARTLTVSTKPAGTTIQWYRNGLEIANATDTFYYAALAGTYTAKYLNNCGGGPVSNSFSFPADVIAQTITFPHTPNQNMAPALKIKLPATSTSGLPIFYTCISGPGTIINDSLSISAIGTIIVKAMQPGDDVYSPAVPKYDTIIVVKGNQVINFAPIADRMFESGDFTINPTSSVGLIVTNSILSGNATISGNTVYVNGAGNITIRATQAGNSNYNAATPVDQTFCVGIDTLSAITGSSNVCLGTYTYNAQRIPGANYVWTLSGGGTMTTSNDTAFVTWQTTGTHTLKVKANSSCNSTFSFEPQISVTIGNPIPTPVSYMLPVNNAQNQSLPLLLSWIPGENTETYDLFVWDSATAQPGTPYKSNITGISYTIPQLAFAYNTTYKWRLVSKNPCNQVSGPIQTFRLIPLPDVQVTSVLAPTSAISGQTITINWTVKNNGPGNTPTGESWEDAVYLSFDSLPNFSIAPEVDPNAWSHLNFPVRALLLGTRTNVAALASGQQYSNSINFTIPINYSLPVYAFVITNIGNNGILEVTKINDSAHSANPINITLAPTPDLRVDSMFTTSSTFSGSTVNVSYKVKNYGSLTPAGTSWNDVAYLSQNLLFDSSTAIKLNAPKVNGSYYPYAVPAGKTINTQLQNDSAYYESLQVVIPNNIFGIWFLHVKTNNNGSLYEGASFNNNTNNNPIQIYLTPTPKLTVDSLTLAVTQASITQPIGLNWNIRNEGFRDNIEKNRGHYITMSSCVTNCPQNSPPNSICTTPAVIADSVSFGSSYWVDKVYLSTDSTGLDLANAIFIKETTHGIYNSGFYTDPNPNYISCPALVSGNVNVSNIINPGSNFPSLASFNIPSNLQAGTYYIYVWANATKSVFEYPGTPQIKRTGALIIKRPDAVVSSINTPANAVAGQPIQIGYTITNNGPGTVYNHFRKDDIYISTSPVFNASAELIGTNTFTEVLPVGAAIPHSFNYTLPATQSGTRYFFVQTNIDSAFRETVYSNNTSVAATTLYSPATPADLLVTSIQTTDTIVTVFPSKITYTITNNGSIAVNGTSTDNVFVSCTNVYGQSTAFKIGSKQKNRNIAAGSSITDTFNLNIPFTYKINSCFSQYDFNNGYFFIKVNADGGIYEGANTNNNITGTGLKVLDNPVVDHIVTSVTGADSAIVGHAYNISWDVKNIGRNPGINYSGRWDSIYVSVDSVLNGNAVCIGRMYWTDNLNQNELKTLSHNSGFANVPSGYYYILVKDNASKDIGAEKNYTNNVNLIRDINNAAKKIWVTRPLLSDLTDSIISAPASIALGQPATIIHRIKNIGNAATYPNSFVHEIHLANDPSGTPNYGSLYIKRINLILQPGQYIDDTVQVWIPASIASRIYTLYSNVDHFSEIAEVDESNNAGISFVNVFTPDPSDLIVQDVTAPDTVMLGYKMDSAHWVIKNNSGVSAVGYSSDGIYLTQSEELDSSAVLIGIKTKYLQMAPLNMDMIADAPLVTGVTEGNYNMVIRTDLLDQMPETDETNNTAITAGQVYVKVKEVVMNVVENNTLEADPRFYKLIIPDSLNGATISVKLTTGDSLTRVNQMFIGKGYIPTAAHFDYTYPTANYGNQDIVMAYTTAGTYYIMIRAINPGSVVQNISLLAKKLPFIITSVHTNSGGNIGNVTVKISGSLFTPGMTAKLNKPGTEIIASAVYFTNTTTVYATFNLQGKPLGIYDVTLSKADTAFAILTSGFSVVPANNGGVITGGGNNTGSGNGNAPGCDPGAASGLNSQLGVELLVPAYVMRAWPFVIQINYINPTNFDLPAQVRTLYAEDIIKMAYTQQELDNNGVHTLTLQLTEQGGPPGIIRAGGSGTILIFGKSASNVEAHTITLFSLQ